jgi:hypothetical protein
MAAAKKVVLSKKPPSIADVNKEVKKPRLAASVRDAGMGAKPKSSSRKIASDSLTATRPTAGSPDSPLNSHLHDLLSGKADKNADEARYSGPAPAALLG